MQVLRESKFAEEKFFKLKDSTLDPYGYGYDELICTKNACW
jgi:hypothetical protein